MLVFGNCLRGLVNLMFDCKKYLLNSFYNITYNLALNFNLAKYSTLIKVLSIIPVLVGFLNLIESILPYKTIETVVVSKSENHRDKFDHTTYNIYFENNNDQFTETIYNTLNEGDKVTLHASFFTEEVSNLTINSTEQTLENSTSEIYFKYLFTIVFLIPSIFWFKKKSLSSKQSKYMVFIIVFSLISFYRIIKLNIT